MTRFTPQWLQAGSYAGSVDRRLIGALWPAPASSGVQVTAGTAMALNVAAGQVAVPTPNNTGTVLCSSDATEQVTLDLSPAANNSRIDLVVCRARGTDLDGGTDNDFIFDKVTGAVVASPGTPVVPATPPGCVALARVAVAGGVASIVAGNITDVRPFALAVPGPGARPPLGPTDGIASYTDPGGQLWVAKGGVYGGAWRLARDVLQARVYRQAAYTIPTAGGSIMFDTVTFDPWGMYFIGNGVFSVPFAGLYQLNAKTAAGSVPASGQLTLTVYISGTLAAFVNNGSSPAAATPLHVNSGAFVARLGPGDQIYAVVSATSALAAAVGSTQTYASLSYLGTG